MSILFKPTARCPRVPDNRGHGRLPKPCPDLSDDQIDQALAFMISHGAEDMLLPLTQYGRRIAVQAHLAYEAIPAVFGDGPVLVPKNPSQPR